MRGFSRNHVIPLGLKPPLMGSWIAGGPGSLPEELLVGGLDRELVRLSGGLPDCWLLGGLHV